MRIRLVPGLPTVWLLLAPLLVLPTVAPLFAQGPARAFTSEDALDVRTVRVADVTPDARWIAATVSTRRDRSNVDHFRFGDPTYIAPSLGELLVVDATTGASRSVFPAHEQLRGATWSPDAKRLALFRLQDGAWSLYTYDATSGRATRVALKSGKAISSDSPLAWSPDGTQLLLALRPDGWAERARAAFVQLTDGPIVVQTSKDDFLDWDRVRGMADEEIAALVTVSSGAVKELPLTVSLADPHFSTDGSYLVYGVADARRTAYERAKGTWYGLYRLPLTGGSVDTLIAPREQRLTGRWNEQATRYAYAEKGNVFVRALSGDSAVNLTTKYRTPISATDTTKLSYAVDTWRPDGAALLLTSKKGYHLLDVASASMTTVFEFQGDEDKRPRLATQAWSADGRTLYMTTSARDTWARGLVTVDVATGRMNDLVKDTNLYGDWHVAEDGSRIVYRMSDGDAPDELYSADAAFGQVKKLTTLNPQLAGVAIAKSELVEYMDVDGNRLYGVLYYPYGYQVGRKYPLVSEVYESFFDNGYNENMNLVMARGFFGFRPSVDLEIGYPGEAWVKGVPTAINTLVARGIVDEKQLGVYGQSYGGYAVNLLVTQTDRFAAAVNVSGKVNTVSFLGDSEKITTRNYNAAEEGQDRLGATLWEQPQKYLAASAVMFADRIKTPLLLMSGQGDWNVPATNQREMYYALRRLGREVEWVNYMNGGHGAGRASNVADFNDHWKRLLDWMQEHFDKATAEKSATAKGLTP